MLYHTVLCFHFYSKKTMHIRLPHIQTRIPAYAFALTHNHTHTCYVVHIAINNIQESCNAQGQKRLPVVITI